MRGSKQLLLVLITLFIIVSAIIIANGASFHIRRNTVLEYDAVFYAVVHGVRGEPIKANVTAIIVGLTSNYSEIQEFKYVQVMGANNTSRTLEYRDRFRILYPSNESMAVGAGTIPYLLSTGLTSLLWKGNISADNIDFWNLTNETLIVGNSINTSIGSCKCIIVSGLSRKEYLIHNVTAKLCYNEYGLLGYARIITDYIEPESMRGNIRVIEYVIRNATVKLNTITATALATRNTTTQTTSSTNSSGFNCTLVYLPIILVLIGIGVWFRLKYLRK